MRFPLFSRKICCKKRTCFILAGGVVIYYSYPGGVLVNNSLTDWLRSASYTLRYIHVVYGAQRRRHVFVVISFLCFGRLFSLPFLQMLDSSIQDQDSWSLAMGGRQAGQSTCVYTCLGIGVGFFAICDVFFIYIFHCVFSLSIFFLCLANSFTHIYRGLWRRRRQWVSGFFIIIIFI